MSSTATTSSAQQTDPTSDREPHQSTPPLLPAFLITGLLLAAIVFIIVWRHLIERRNLERDEDDPTWPSDGISGGSGGAKGPTPKLWELQFASGKERATWEDIMPLSVVPLRAKGKPRLPRYLVPSDRPISFLTRTFGGDRRRVPPPSPPPPISLLRETPNVVAQTESFSEEDDEYDGPVERVQVAVLIALPHPHYARRASYPPEKEGTLKTIAECSELEEPDSPVSPDKGKKRSLELPAFVAKSDYDYDDDEGQLEVAFGTAVLPFIGGMELETAS